MSLYFAATFLSKLQQNQVVIIVFYHDAVVGHLEDIRLGVLVDGHDALGRAHPGQVFVGLVSDLAPGAQAFEGDVFDFSLPVVLQIPRSLLPWCPTSFLSTLSSLDPVR